MVSADTKVSAEGGAGDAPGARAEIPLQPLVQPRVRQLCPCSPGRAMGRQRSTCSLGGDPHQSRWMPKGGCEPVGSPCWSRLLAGPEDPWRERDHAGAGLLAGFPWEPMLEQTVHERLNPM